jgi:hypothetical protein
MPSSNPFDISAQLISQRSAEEAAASLKAGQINARMAMQNAEHAAACAEYSGWLARNQDLVSQVAGALSGANQANFYLSRNDEFDNAPNLLLEAVKENLPSGPNESIFLENVASVLSFVFLNKKSANEVLETLRSPPDAPELAAERADEPHWRVRYGLREVAYRAERFQKSSPRMDRPPFVNKVTTIALALSGDCKKRLNLIKKRLYGRREDVSNISRIKFDDLLTLMFRTGEFCVTMDGNLQTSDRDQVNIARKLIYPEWTAPAHIEEGLAPYLASSSPIPASPGESIQNARSSMGKASDMGSVDSAAPSKSQP